MSFWEGLDIVGTLAGSLDGLKATFMERRKEEKGKEKREGGKHEPAIFLEPQQLCVPMNGISKFVPICSP